MQGKLKDFPDEFLASEFSYFFFSRPQKKGSTFLTFVFVYEIRLAKITQTWQTLREIGVGRELKVIF